MTKRKKDKVDAEAVTPPAICLWRVKDGAYYETESVAYQSADGKLEKLDCECGALSAIVELERDDNVACDCPACGELFALTVKRGEVMIEPETTPVEGLEGIEGLAVGGEKIVEIPQAVPPKEPPKAVVANSEEASRALQIQVLTEEWMDLEFRLEQLDDEKRSFLSGYKKDVTKCSKRIHELKNEITAIKSGATALPADNPPAERQVPLFTD